MHLKSVKIKKPEYGYSQAVQYIFRTELQVATLRLLCVNPFSSTDDHFHFYLLIDLPKSENIFISWFAGSKKFSSVLPVHLMDFEEII